MKNKNFIRWLMIATSFVIVSLILWNTYVFFKHFKNEEHSKMQSWTLAYSEFAKAVNTALGDDVEINETVLHIVQDSTISTPMLLTDINDDIILHRNIFADSRLKNNPNTVATDSIDDAYVQKHKQVLIERFKTENTPLIIENLDWKLYYGNSPLLNKLKYYPLALLLIIILFGAVVYFFYRSTKIAEQNKLWSGMAKETAHQIGTPLSSLIGWTELLKAEKVNPEYILEIENDISRLQTITERFSKIGSIPELQVRDIVQLTKQTIAYLRLRSSKLIHFETDLPDYKIPLNLNESLFGWTVENLVKNAIDAMKGRGKLTLNLFEKDKYVYLRITDTGKGMTKQQFTKVFEPGYTTKKRGWGLGLSLAKRIIEGYHDGKIKVLRSEVGKGTTFQIMLKKL